jgi:hypothetical protein
MFNKNDPMISTVKKIMEENAKRRAIEEKLCEELGILSRAAVPHEHVANFNALLEERISKAFGDGTLMEENERAKDEDKKKKDDDDTPPFDADKKKSTPWTSPSSKAKHLARNAMKDMVKKTAKKVDEEAEDLQELSKETLHSYIKKSTTDRAATRKTLDKQQRNGPQIYGGSKEYDDYVGNSGQSNGALERKISKRKSGKRLAIKKLMREENLQELSKGTLKSYIKKASDDVDNKSSQRTIMGSSKREYEPNREKKYFKLSDKIRTRKKGISRAVDKLEENGTEVTLESVMKEITQNLGEAKVKSVKESDWMDNSFASTDKQKEKSTSSSSTPEPAPASRADSSAEKETPSATGTALGAATRSGPLGAALGAARTIGSTVAAGARALGDRASIGNSAMRSAPNRGSAQAATSPPAPAIRATAPGSGGVGSGGTPSGSLPVSGNDGDTTPAPVQPTATAATPARPATPVRPAAARPAATRPAARVAPRAVARPANAMSDRDRNALRLGGAVDAFSESGDKKK